MSLWWLTYNRHGRLHGAVIVEAASLISACVGVADSALEKGVSFVEGHELDEERAARIPPGYVGMMLSRKEVGQLLDRIERAMAKGGRLRDPSNSAAGTVAGPMTLSAKQRRALAMLAPPGHNGATPPFLIAHGFGDAMISGLVNRGLVTLTSEKIRAGGKMIHVAMARITAAGREALAAEG